MVKRFAVVLLLCALLGVTPVVVRAQDAAANIARAQQTLDEIARLLDAVASRHAGPAPDSAAQPTETEAGGWTRLFDGVTLGGWKITGFSGGGQAHIVKSFRGGPPAIVVNPGEPLSGITSTRTPPRMNYEISLEAMKIDGEDFLCGLTFPVRDAYASLILGGWGGSIVGISSIDGLDASENETSRTNPFPKDRWFAIRMRVTPEKLETWLDDKKIIDEPITGKKIGLRFGEISKSVPLGLATYRTAAAYRNIKIRLLDAK